MRFLLALLCAMLPFSALADSAGADPLAPLKNAIALAEAHKEDRFAFTVEYWTAEAGKETTVRLRFDPRRPEGERWRLVGQDMVDFDEKTQKNIRKLEKQERPDDKLVYDKAGEILKEAELQKETADAYLYAGPVIDEDLPKDALQMVITVPKATGHISMIETRSLKPFKPAAVAKIKSVVQTQAYTAPSAESPALLARAESEAKGSALFQKFDIRTRETYSDIEAVIVPAPNASAE